MTQTKEPVVMLIGDSIRMRYQPEVEKRLRGRARVIDRRAALAVWREWRRHNFAQFQRQAKRGLYHDSSYALRDHPSSDYRDILNNAFTGWTEEDEARVNDWVRL